MTFNEFKNHVIAACEEMGITINDLADLAPLCERLDYRHEYLKIIYNAYLANGNMTMTDEQRREAFEEYKKED